MQGVLEKSVGVNLQAVAESLADATSGAVVVASPNGEVLAWSSTKSFLRDEWRTNRVLPKEVTDGLLAVATIEVNVQADFLRPMVQEGSWPPLALIVPVYADKERMGTLLVLRQEGGFDHKDRLLAEYAAVIFALEGEKRLATPDGEARAREVVKTALDTLSFSEFEAVVQVLSELSGEEGVVVASRVADRAGITRSVIVNALRKLESAQIIASRSLGMKGTYIKILNPQLVEELRQVRLKR